jgi:hypothetical protein
MSCPTWLASSEEDTTIPRENPLSVAIATTVPDPKATSSKLASKRFAIVSWPQ